MTGRLWSRDDLADAARAEVTGDWPGVSGIAIDTREMAPGDLFVALAGDNRDGHLFVAQALAAGAAAAMVTHRPGDVPADAPLLIVDDTLKALRRIAAAARARTAARVVAVTGSVGKTSTKEMLRTMLDGQGKAHAAVRSFNNHWGVPLTLARMPADTDYAVIEIGMNSAGEIAPLSQLARPDVALITTVEAVHLEAFASVAEIANAKAEIVAGLGPDGVAVLPADNPHIDRLTWFARPHRVVTFGAAGGDVRLGTVTLDGPTTRATVYLSGTPVDLSIGAPGAHFALNAAGALAAVAALGADPARAARALAAWRPPEGRGSDVTIATPGGPITLLDESYNANPASMRAALAVLAAAETNGRRVAILGDMLELGPDEMAFHRDLAGATEGADLVHTCGPRMAALHAALPDGRRGRHAADSAALAAEIAKIVAPGDVVMVKGSLGARMATVVAALKALASTPVQGTAAPETE